MCGTLAVTALLLALAVRYPTVRDENAAFSPSRLLERRVGWLAAATALASAGYGAIATFITVYAVQYGIRQPGTFFTLYALGLVVSRVGGGRLFDRIGARVPILGGLGAIALGLLWLGSPSRGGFLAAAVVFGLGMGAITSSTLAMAVNWVPIERRGAATAMVLSAMDLGIGAGGSLLGLVAQATGSYATMYIVGAAATCVPLLAFALKVLPAYARETASARS